MFRKPNVSHSAARGFWLYSAHRSEHGYVANCEANTIFVIHASTNTAQLLSATAEWHRILA
jgi:hypothetical protein